MAFRLAPRALILLLLNSLVIIVIAAASTPPTSARFFTDSNCKSLFATVQTAANVGNGQCGILPAGISSASSVFLDDGCYVTIYTDDCDDNATAVRLNDCTALSAAAFSIDCPGINGTYDPGYTTSTAEGTPSTTSETPVVQSTDGASPSLAVAPTTVPEQGQSSVTNTPDPSPAHTPSSTPSSFITTSPSTVPTLSSPSQSATLSPLTSKSPTSPSALRNFQTSLQSSSSSSSSASSPSSSSSPSPSPSPSPSSAKSQQETNNNGSLSGHTKLILATVLPTVGIVALILGMLRISHTKKAPTSREESGSSSSNPFSDLVHYLGLKAELEGDKSKHELDASPTSGHHELGSTELYEMESRRKKETGIHELNGDGQHPRELD